MKIEYTAKFTLVQNSNKNSNPKTAIPVRLCVREKNASVHKKYQRRQIVLTDHEFLENGMLIITILALRLNETLDQSQQFECRYIDKEKECLYERKNVIVKRKDGIVRLKVEFGKGRPPTQTPRQPTFYMYMYVLFGLSLQTLAFFEV